ncbi:MAG: DUF2157 domain-containing protein [Balneolaceae bacterium]|nr:DUF2157 domain-containing protein [Balneolaceae bacterium]MCH8547893.1 DUF2157 domain-containing protein [Balneolaceae bacterium]
MSIRKELPELVNAEVISQETADRISSYYNKKSEQSGNRLFLVFGILGALLVGLGIILIMAHNWDELSRPVKTGVAFLPLITGQLLCGYVFLKKPESIPWRESSSLFLFLSVGASIALMGQIYNIPGSLGPFLLTWMVLCLPLIYVMKSSITSLFYIAGITWYATETGFWSSPSEQATLYWILLAGALPYYVMLAKNHPQSNFTGFHHWVVPFSVIISLGTLAGSATELMLISYVSLFGFFYLLGNSSYFKGQKLKRNGYKVTGALGTVGMLVALSFSGFWDHLNQTNLVFNELIAAPELFSALINTSLAGWLFTAQQKGRPLSEIKPLSTVFILFIALFLYGLILPGAVVFINLMVVVIGILMVLDGAKQNRLGLLNFGMVVLSALIICRFFDIQFSFVVRGFLFVLAGAGFIAVNYWMLKKRGVYES